MDKKVSAQELGQLNGGRRLKFFHNATLVIDDVRKKESGKNNPRLP